MKLIPILAAAAVLSTAVPAVAAPITLDFEDQTSFGSLTYPANPAGIDANGALLALENDGTGTGTGSNGEFFSNNPSGSKVMFAFGVLPGERAEITSSVGFSTAVSFYYSAAESALVSVRDAGGALLNQVLLTANSTSETSPFNTWALATLTFNGIASSIDFSDAADKALAFDDVTLAPVPLPAAAWLLLSGIGGLGAFARRRRQSA